jgi:hypothetical protein
VAEGGRETGTVDATGGDIDAKRRVIVVQRFAKTLSLREFIFASPINLVVVPCGFLDKG